MQNTLIAAGGGGTEGDSELKKSFIKFCPGFDILFNRFWDDFVLSESKPTNCPHEDETTHVCSVISSANTTCTDTVIECETEDHEEYSESTESDEHHGHGPHHNHHHRHHQCR